jgi:hypothetical protein
MRRSLQSGGVRKAMMRTERKKSKGPAGVALRRVRVWGAAGCVGACSGKPVLKLRNYQPKDEALKENVIAPAKALALQEREPEAEVSRNCTALSARNA